MIISSVCTSLSKPSTSETPGKLPDNASVMLQKRLQDIEQFLGSLNGRMHTVELDLEKIRGNIKTLASQFYQMKRKLIDIEEEYEEEEEERPTKGFGKTISMQEFLKDPDAYTKAGYSVRD